MERAVIFTGGLPATIELRDGDFIVCADAGYRQIQDSERIPDLVVGDFDSQDKAAVKAREIITLPREKDDTDTHFAAREVLRRGYREVLIVGGTGGLLHHTLANIATLCFLRASGAQAELHSAGNRLTVLQNETRVLEAQPGDWLSVFAQGEAAQGVSLTGLKYPLADATLTREFPVGACNEFLRESATAAVKNGTLLVVITKRTNQ